MVVTLALTVSACGGGGEERFDPFEEIEAPSRDAATGTRDAAPRWEGVRTFAGTGRATRPFTVARGAIQWRVRWRCRSGTLRLMSVAGARRNGLVDARCPRAGISPGSGSGALQLDVDTPGRWQATIEQQVDTPLREPPLATMSSPAARVIAGGSFYDLERTGRGSVALYRLGSGRLALRFDGAFATSANTDLFVWLSTAARPRTTVQAARARHVVLRSLKSTLGGQNYLLPRGTRPEAVRSIVIWCNPVRIAYTAAALRPT